MKKGSTYHAKKAGRNYGFKNCETYYQLYVESKKHDIASVPDVILKFHDYVVILENKRFIQGRPPFSVIAQAVAGGICAEEHFNLPLREVRVVGFNGATTKILVTQRLRNQVLQAIDQLKATLRELEAPDPTPDTGKCYACEYRNVCGTI